MNTQDNLKRQGENWRKRVRCGTKISGHGEIPFFSFAWLW
jgi:hypothetical protein